MLTGLLLACRFGLCRCRTYKTELSGGKGQGCHAKEAAAVSIISLHPVHGDVSLFQ
jgi:hypothetical protein